MRALSRDSLQDGTVAAPSGPWWFRRLGFAAGLSLRRPRGSCDIAFMVVLRFVGEHRNSAGLSGNSATLNVDYGFA